jgi:hypothetical protein
MVQLGNQVLGCDILDGKEGTAKIPGISFFFFWQSWGLNSRPCTCWAGALPLSHALSPCHLFVNSLLNLGLGLGSTRVSGYLTFVFVL